jgi:signal transduction histidine kinase/PAS domain-containing protein
VQPPGTTAGPRTEAGIRPLGEALVWRLDATGAVVHAARGALGRLLGGHGPSPWSVPALLGRLAVPEHLDRLVAVVREVAADQAPRSCLHRVRLPGGEALLLETRVFAAPDSASLWGTTVPVDGRRRREPSAFALQALLRALPATVLAYDAQGRLARSRGPVPAWARRRRAMPGWFEAELTRALGGVALLGGGQEDGRTYEVHFRPRARARGAVAVVLETTAWQRAAAGARARARDLLAVLDAVAEGISVLDADGQLVFVNRSAMSWLHLDRDRLARSRDPRQQPAFEHFRDEQGRPVPSDALPGRQALRGEPAPERLLRYRVPGADQDRWSLVRAVPLRDEHGALRLVVNAWTDVTEILHAKEQLRAQAALLRASSRASPNATLVVSSDARVLDYNRQFLELWGIPEALMATGDDAPVLRFARDKLVDPDAFEARVREIYAAPEATTNDELLMRDGRVLERYSAPARSETGEYYGRAWFFHDITDRRRAELRERQLLEARVAKAAAENAQKTWQFLAEVSRRLGATLELDTVLAEVSQLALSRLCECVVIDLREDGLPPRRTVAANAQAPQQPAVERLRRMAVDPEAPAGAAWVMRTGRSRLDRLPGQPDPGAAWSPLGERGPEAAGCLAELGVRWVLTLPLAVYEHSLGAITFARASPPSPSEQRLSVEVAGRAATAISSSLLYRKAQRAIGLRDDFLSVASHELRTPMTALRLALQSLQRQAAAHPEGFPPQATKLIHAAERHERRLAKLVDTLLDVTRIQGGRLELELEPVDLAQVARETCALFQGEAARTGTALTVEADAPAWGRWDRSRLEQVVTNLVSNALKYGAGAPVQVQVRGEPERAVLVVRDQGIGIPLERQGKLFERFERAVSSRHYAGLGLGLYIVRGIVQALGGTVQVQSTPGDGSTFTVTLPRTRSAP